MFLNALNEREGKNFLELANIAMKVDGMIEEREQAIMETYRMELKLQDYQIKNKDPKDIMTALLGSTKRVKKVILIELAGILDADEEIDSSEEAWIKKLGADLGFRESEVKKMVRWTQDFNDLLNEAVAYIEKR